MLSINTNVASLFGAYKFNSTSNEIEKITTQLATGKRINSAADDPAGLGIVSALNAQTRGYEVVMKNLQSGRSLLGVADTSLMTQQELLQDMKALATEAASDLLSTEQRAALQAEFAQLQTQLDETVNNANLFGQNLTGAAAADVDIQSGINAGDTFTITAAQSDATTLGVNTLDLTSSANASTALGSIDTAINTVAVSQSTIGAQMTGLDKIQANAESMIKNLKASVSRVEDVDIAQASAKLAQLETQAQLQLQMLSITNQMPQFLLQLLR